MSITFEALQKDVLYLRAKLDADYDGLRKQGLRVMDPYRGNPLPLRLLRELFFRLRLPLRRLFYNPALAAGRWPVIIAEDPLLTRDFLLWLREKHPESRIIISYKNLVGRSQHVLPGDIPEGMETVTYDAGDARKYGMKLNPRLYITPEAKVKKQEPPPYDAVFIGRDKGRMAYLQKLEAELQAQGLRTYFHIVKNRRFSPNKKGYRPELPYAGILSYVAQTRAVINIVYSGQDGMTVRDMESATNGIKLITNNASIKSAALYYPENVFILQERALSELPAFLDAPFHPLPEDFFEKNSLFGWLKLTLGYET